MSTTTVRALVVQHDGTPAVRRIGNDLPALKDLLDGGYLEAISPRHPDSPTWHAYIDEEGKLKGLPMNPAADELARVLGWVPLPGDVLVGTVIFLGDGVAGEEADVPEQVIRVARVLYDGIGITLPEEE